MRLTDYEIESIKKAFYETFVNGKVYLFGSRLDDTKRDGDIDLYIQTEYKNDLLLKKVNFLAMLKEKIGDQKIDVVISKDKNRVIEQEAINKGLEL